MSRNTSDFVTNTRITMNSGSPVVYYVKQVAFSKWPMILFAFLYMFFSAVVNYSVKLTSVELEKILDIDNTRVNFLSVSVTYILAIPLCLYGSLIISKMGVSNSLILWPSIALVGWMLFCISIQYKIYLLALLGRAIQGGAFGAARVSLNALCSKWFEKKHIALSMAIIRQAHNVAHILGGALCQDFFIDHLHWSAKTLYWFLSGFVGISLLMAISISLKDKHLQKTRKQSISDVSFIKMKRYNVKQVWEAMKRLFKNPIFVLMIFVGICYDAPNLTFNSIQKKLLIEKFKIKQKTGFETGISKHMGLAAPVFGYLFDCYRYRQYYLVVSGIVACFAHGLLYFGGIDKGTRISGLFFVGVAMVFYGNSYWPSIASVAGAQDQIVAYGFLGATTALGAVILPIIVGKISDIYHFTAAELVLFSVSGAGLILAIVICIINSMCIYRYNTDYMNRKISPTNDNKSDTTTNETNDTNDATKIDIKPNAIIKDKKSESHIDMTQQQSIVGESESDTTKLSIDTHTIIK